MYSVLIVEGSALTRKIIRDTINQHNDFNVVGHSTAGENAFEKVKAYNPDIITIDVEMEKIDGLQFIKRVMEEDPRPILIISSHSKEESSLTFEGLEAGAVDFLLKPHELNLNGKFDEFKKELIDKLEIAINSKPKFIQKNKKKVVHKFKKAAKQIVVFGASTGGPSTLKKLFSELPGNLPFSILLVQHMPKGFTKPFAEHLNKISDFEVKEAEHGEKILDNTAYICPADFHIIVLQDPDNTDYNIIHLSKDERVNGVRPSVDFLMKSVVPIYKEKIILVVLTGMGKDGLEGAKLVKAKNGKVLVESEESCIIYGMPKAIADKNLADAVVSLEKLPVSIIQEVDD